MDVIKQVGPWAILCRNHEAAIGPAFVDGRLRYSPAAAGGNTNLIFDTQRAKWVTAWPTLSGTVRNCAGGGTDHKSWLCCEETGDSTMDAAGNVYTHGWVFDVPGRRHVERQAHQGDGPPLARGGRRRSEAGYVYLTEDTTPGGIYRFKPNRTRAWEAPYANGGKLEMLKIVGHGRKRTCAAQFQRGGDAYPCGSANRWTSSGLPIDDPENLNARRAISRRARRAAPPTSAVPKARGTAMARCSSSAPTAARRATARSSRSTLKRQTLTMIYDAPVINGSPSELDNPDNLTVTPRGSLLFCEDNSGNPTYLLDGMSTERMVALTRTARSSPSRRISSTSARANSGRTRARAAGRSRATSARTSGRGACFDRTGKWLFANIQTPGVTFAITGPWHHGPI